MSVSETLLTGLEKMRPSEAAVARRLLRHLPIVADKSLREVAAVCRTSDATVMRACRAAGYDGFQDLKYYVLRELTNGEVELTPPSEGAYEADLKATLRAVERNLEPAAALLRSAHRIVLAGVGASHGVALVASDILFTLQKQALPALDDQVLSFALTPPVEGLLVLAISHSGETRFPLRVVREARLAGVKSIGLTNEPAGELARAVDVVLSTQAVEPARGSYAISPRICQLAVLDALFSRVRSSTPGNRTSQTPQQPERNPKTGIGNKYSTHSHHGHRSRN
jgi:DNA-binding MurR/RpiR family transcriptional regulator